MGCGCSDGTVSQVRVMEILLWCAMRRSCGGPVGSEMEEEEEVRN